MVKQQPTLPVRFSVRRPHAGQRGVSLVEILVAIVILVVGILTIIRLFPGGFLVVRSGENSTIADRLGQAAIEGLKQDGNGLPDAIYASYLDSNGSIQFDPNVRPNDLDPYSPPGSAVGYNANNDNLNKTRFIKNETITVPAARVGSAGSPDSIHVLRYGPIFLDAAALPMPKDQPPGRFESNLSVNGVPWTAQAGDARLADPGGSRAIDEPNDILTPGQTSYLVDTAGARIAVPHALYTQAFTFVFRVQPAAPAPAQTYIVRMVVPPLNPASPAGTPNTQNNYYGGWFSLDTLNGQTFSYVKRVEDANGNIVALPTGSWIFGSTMLMREFRCLSTPTGMTLPFTADPYEYALVNANFPGSNANIGALAFNPRAAGQQGGRAPLQARISYTVLDWHIIHEDRQVPDQGSHTVRLALNNLKKIGDPPSNPGGDVYNGFIPATSSPADFLILDLDTGKSITGPNAIPIGNADDTDAGSPTDINVSYNGGRVTFPPKDTSDPTDPKKFNSEHVRVFYAGALDWGVAVQKAPALYRHRLNPMTGQDVTTGLQVAEYAVAPMITMTAGNKKFQRVYFPLCDAGKTVEFDGISYPGGNDLREQTIALDEREDAGRAYADLPVPGYVGMGGGVTFTAVRGVSVRSVIIWKERGDWKTRNVDTLLTRAE